MLPILRPRKGCLSWKQAPRTQGPTGLPPPMQQAHAGTRAQARARTRARPADDEVARTAHMQRTLERKPGTRGKDPKRSMGLGGARPFPQPQGSPSRRLFRPPPFKSLCALRLCGVIRSLFVYNFLLTITTNCHCFPKIQPRLTYCLQSPSALMN